MIFNFIRNIIYRILRFIVRIYMRIKYGFKATKFRGLKGPYIVLINHVSILDPLMISLSFKDEIRFLASDIIFDGSLGSKFVQSIFRPISIAKGSSDAGSVKAILKAVKNGDIIGIFPSGNTTYSGRTSKTQPTTYKLIKKLNVPCVLYRTDGLYGVDPRWGKQTRKGKSMGEVKRVLMPDELSKMSVDEIKEVVDATLSTPMEFLSLSSYKSKASAEYLERVLYLCPDCGSISSLYSEKDTISCTKCGYSASYGTDLRLAKIKGEKDYDVVSDWFYDQLEFLKNVDLNNYESDEVIFSDEGTRVSTKGKCEKRKLICENVTLSLTKEKLCFGDDYIEIGNITNIAPQNRNTMIVYTASGVTYVFNGTARTNHYKYISFITHIKFITYGENKYGFLEL